jgi:hypothetical protein
MVAPIDASRLVGRLAMALRRAGGRPAGSTGTGAAAASRERAGVAKAAGGGNRKGRSDGPGGIDPARRTGSAHAERVEWARPAGQAPSAAGREARADRSEQASSTSSLVALLRAGVAALGGDPVAHRRRATRWVVEALLGREFAPRMRADPHYPGWIDGVAEALEDDPTWRSELDALMTELDSPGPASGARRSAVAPFAGESSADGSASGLPNCSTRSA